MPAVDSRPKYMRLAQDIETSLRGGQWKSGRISSVRGIAETHGVSVVTASRALQVLRDKGLISTVERSGCFLNGGASAVLERCALCLRITPGPFQQAADMVNRRGFDSLAKATGVQFEPGFVLDPEPSDRELARQARRLVDDGMAGLILLPSRISDSEMRLDERILSACRSARLPVVLIERNLRGLNRPLECDLVCADDVAGGASITRHMLKQGRKRIAMVVASPCSSHTDRLAGYLSALNAMSRNPQTPLVFTERVDLPSKDAYRQLVDELLAADADAAVCYQDYTAIGLVLELLARGKRVPKDVAVAGFDDLPIGTQFAIGVTTWRFPADEVARHALQLLRTRGREFDAPPIKILVTSEVIVRDSTVGAQKALSYECD